MTYQSEVLTDAPVHYLRLDETSGTTAANLGSSGLAATISGTTMNEPAAGTLDGKSMKFPNASTANVSAPTAGNLATNFTIELWHKRDTTITSNTNRALARFGSATTYLKLMLNPTTGQLWMQDNTAGGVGLITVPSLTEGNWHHIAVSKSGSTFTFYVDGASVGSGTLSIGTKNTTFVVGTGTAAENAAAWLDEAAYYPTALDSTRIAAHYAAGTAVAGVSVSTVAPAMSVSISAPAVTPRTTKAVSVISPAMAVSLTAPAPVVTAVDNSTQTLSPTADAATGTTGGGTSGTVTFGNSSFQGNLFFKFPDAIIPAGQHVVSAILELTRNNTTAASTSYTLRQMDRALVESDNNTFGYASTSLGSGNIPSGSSGGKAQIDVTAAYTSGSPYGFALVYVSGSNPSFAMRENATVDSRPKLIVQLADIPQVHTVSTVDGPMSVSVDMPQHRSGTGTKVSLTGAGSVGSISMTNPIVSAQRNIRAVSPAITLTLQMPGGESRNPDQYIRAGFMESWIFAPNATQYISVPSINQATPMEVSLAGTSDTNISLKTDRRVFVTTPMKMNTAMVGIYSEEGDRYPAYIPLTTDSDDQWLKMDETTGTSAVDTIGGDTNATYYGSPEFSVVGPQLRKAVRFDGLDDHMRMPAYPTGAFADMDLTIEFSIKTTQLNGTLVRGGGAATNSATIYAGTNDSEVRLLNGELVLYTGSGNNLVYRTRRFVADGEWHHVVISLPSLRGVLVNDFNLSAGQPFFVTVDGKVEWARYGAPLYGRSFLPSSVMARLSGGIASNFVAGDMRDFIVRYHYAVSQNTAQKLYYEWSNALVVNPEPITLSLSMPKPHSARGNTKRMLALYGLPYYIREAGFTTQSSRDGYLNYFSVYAGFGIPNGGGATVSDTGVELVDSGAFSNITPMQYLGVQSFEMEGWLVHPVAIMHQPGGNGGPFSAPGMENGEYFDRIAGAYIDDKTGLPRFVDLNLDLNEDVTDFDALTAINYPAAQPEDGVGHVSGDSGREFRQHNMGLSDSEWRAARDNLRDSILDAAYRGVSLWITEPHMAENLGFIQAWDKHETGARVEFAGAGGVDPTGYTNTRAQELNAARLTLPLGSLPEQAAIGRGQFNFTWQANAKRKIINLENGLTDLPGYEIAEQIHYTKDNAFDVYSDVVAYDLLDRRNGLQIGDLPNMLMWEQAAYGDGSIPGLELPTSTGVPRRYIISAKPQGVVGKPISKEMDFYYGPYGVVRNNPWKDNIYTIAAEVGSVVRGRPIAGRAFIEFMSPEQGNWIARDTDKSYWHGEKDRNVSAWDFDSRRDYQFIQVIQLVSWFVMTKSTRTAPGFLPSQVFAKNKTDFPMVFTGNRSPKEWVPFISMNARGLHWLSLAEELPAGAAKAFAPAMTISVAAPDVKSTQDRNTTVTVVGAARVDVELRRPANARDNNAVEKALPMVLNLSLAGTGRVNRAEAIQLVITMPDAQVRAGGDSIYVYMDAARNVTLYMKED